MTSARAPRPIGQRSGLFFQALRVGHCIPSEQYVAGLHTVAGTALSEISGNAKISGPKRGIGESSGSLAKKQRRNDDRQLGGPFSMEVPEASIEKPADEDGANDPEMAQVVEESLASRAAEPVQPVVDESGLIRVGPQPVTAHERDIRSAPSSYVNFVLDKKLKVNSANSDAKVPGVDHAGIVEDRQRLLQELTATLVDNGNGHVKCLCDYTGRDLIWSPGPRSMSLEAAYSFSSRDGSLRYHASPNGHFAMTALNLVKRRHPIVVLPLLAAILNANVQTQQATITWAFNALCNAASVHQATGGIISTKAARFERWQAWEEGIQRAALETERTLMRTPPVDEMVSQKGSENLFRVDDSPTQTRTASFRQSQNLEWDRRYPVILRIAAAYGLDTDDFEFYFTIPSGRPDKRTFYPFHVLSRPQAQTIGWDWDHLGRVAARMLRRMRDECNKHAEAKGLGDKCMNETRFVYWMAAHFSSQVQTLKKNMPTATREEIRFCILDRWSLPIVPWIGNVLSASLCKGPDHGIAMKFGISEPDGLVPFDPVEHIDLSQCTITIDTFATNMAMWNYKPESWPGIRSVLSDVPLRHPLWSIEKSAGEEVWGAASDLAIAPIAPVPEFDVPLIPIDAWFSGAALRPRCEQCNADFQSLGSLVQHCRNTHGSKATSTQASVNDAQDTIDAEYWQDKLRCSWAGCGRTFTQHSDRERHMRMHTGDRRHRCDWLGCDYATIDPGHLVAHRRTHVPDQRYACDWPDCDHVATNAVLLAGHKTTHTMEKPWVCDWPDCGKAYPRNAALLIHKKSHTGKAVHRCDVPGCDQVCTQAANLRRHKDRKHPGWNNKKDAA